MSTTSSDLSVSLEPHLKDALRPLLPILPDDISTNLSQALTTTEIHYGLMAEISRWSRSDAGADALKARGMQPASYSTVSLLAGTKTSPSSRFPPYEPSESAEQRSRREGNDRKALTAVVNGLLSVGCSGGAVWWAADKSGWRDEWKVLLALIVAAIVGVSETVLFMIWQSKQTEPRHQKKSQRFLDTRSKKDEGEASAPSSANSGISAKNEKSIHDVRRRKGRLQKDSDVD